MSFFSHRFLPWVSGVVTAMSLVGLVLYGITGLSSPLAATPDKGVLKLTLTIDGTEKWNADDGEWQKATIHENHTFEVVLKATTLESYNSVDPNYYQQQMDRTAKIQAHQKKIMDNYRAATGKDSMAHANAMPDMAQAQDMQKKAQACGTDKGCLQKLAMDMMNQNLSKKAQTPGQEGQVAADIQAMSMDCVNIHGQAFGSKGYEDCMQELGKKRSTRPDPVATDPEPQDEEPHFQYYSGFVDDFKCTVKGHGKINNSGEGAKADVQGMVKGNYTAQADADGNSTIMASSLCIGALVVDVKNKILFTRAYAFPSVSTKTVSYSQDTGKSESTSDQGTYDAPGLGEWMQKIFWNGAPLSGSKTFEYNLPLHEMASAKGSGAHTGKAVLTWSFEQTN